MTPRLGALILAWAWGQAALTGPSLAGPHGPPRQAELRAAPLAPERTRLLDVNRLSLHVSNAGPFAYDLIRFEAGLEYPRGSGSPLAFAAGPWLIGIAALDTLTAISEFGWEFSPGPSSLGIATIDTLHHVVYRTARADTVGRAEWLERGELVGAPLEPDVTEPLLRGDLHLWTVFTDAPTVPPRTVDPRLGGTPPIGVDVTLSAYAFDRPGFASEAAFLEYRLVHRGVVTLDSAWFGVFLDPLAHFGSRPRLSYDVARDLAIAYRSRDDDELYGASGPALGLLWLRGPRAGTSTLRPTSFVAYANGADPVSTQGFLRAMRGERPLAGPMIDPTTLLPSPFWSTGDPVTGAGWVDTTIAHPHTVLAAGPFRFAPGDTQFVAVALLVGRGATRLESVTRLRAQADAAAEAWAEDFVNLPPWVPPPAPRPTRGRAWPNPASRTANIGWHATPGTPLTLDVFDARGRRVRHERTVATQGPDGSLAWDLSDDDGRRVRPGLYLARITGPGFRHTARIVVLD